ncbi:MAG: ribonuclease P protein component [Alphaproteobacteria bacterium]|nr:ribonuclease P protein component [Alphaproteobacteria bacterium]
MTDTTPPVIRMRKRRDFLAVKRNVRWRGTSLRIEARHRNNNENITPPDTIRVGFTATRVTVGNAVKRNRTLRRLRAATQNIAPANFTPGGDYVIIATDKTLNAPWNELTRELKRGLADVARRFQNKNTK